MMNDDNSLWSKCAKYKLSYFPIYFRRHRKWGVCAKSSVNQQYCLFYQSIRHTYLLYIIKIIYIYIFFSIIFSMNEKKKIPPPPLAESKSQKKTNPQNGQSIYLNLFPDADPNKARPPLPPLPPPFFFPYSVEGAEGKTGGDGSKAN